MFPLAFVFRQQFNHIFELLDFTSSRSNKRNFPCSSRWPLAKVLPESAFFSPFLILFQLLPGVHRGPKTFQTCQCCKSTLTDSPINLVRLPNGEKRSQNWNRADMKNQPSLPSNWKIWWDRSVLEWACQCSNLRFVLDELTWASKDPSRHMGTISYGGK